MVLQGESSTCVSRNAWPGRCSNSITVKSLGAIFIFSVPHHWYLKIFWRRDTLSSSWIFSPVSPGWQGDQVTVSRRGPFSTFWGCSPWVISWVINRRSTGKFHLCGDDTRTMNASLVCGRVWQCSICEIDLTAWQVSGVIAAISAVMAAFRASRVRGLSL